MIAFIIGTIIVGCSNRDYSNQIIEEEAKKIAIYTAYGDNEYLLQISQERNVILDLEKKNNGDYIIQVCDLNIECMCREAQGYWVNVKFDGSSSEVIKTNMCLFG